MSFFEIDLVNRGILNAVLSEGAHMIAFALTGLIIGIVIGYFFGSLLVKQKAMKMVNESQTELVEKIEEFNALQKQWEEEKNEMVQAYEADLQKIKISAGDVSKKLEAAMNEARTYRRWAERQFRAVFDEFQEGWLSAKLPDTFQELKGGAKAEVLNQLRPVVEKLQGWMEQLDVGTPEVHFRLGLWHTLESHFREASDFFHYAAKKGMGMSAWLALGDCLWEMEKQDKARQAYEHCLRSDSMPDHVFYRYASVMVENRKYDEGMAALEHILKNKKNNLEVYALASYAYGKLQQDEKALEICKKGLRQYRNSSELRAKMIIPLSRLGNWEEAEKVYEEILEKEEDFAEAPFSMGVAHMHHGDDTKAIQFLKKALQIKEKYPEAYFCLGVIHNRKQKYKKALEYFTKAVELKPNYAEAFYNMKESYEGLKDFNKAIAVLKKATRLNPDYR